MTVPTRLTFTPQHLLNSINDPNIILYYSKYQKLVLFFRDLHNVVQSMSPISHSNHPIFIGWIWTKNLLPTEFISGHLAALLEASVPFVVNSEAFFAPHPCGIHVIISPGRWSTWNVRVFEVQPFFKPCANAAIYYVQLLQTKVLRINSAR